MIRSDYWYKNAIVYALDVETYQDGNGDGIGDFRGLTRRLDYLHGLGVTCVWLLPFFPTPNRDNGYDVSDYYNIDPRLGTLGDFTEFMREAREHGIRVLADLVANHTSDEHPWFEAARSDRRSPYRDWYVWADEPPPKEHQDPVFPGKQDRTWTYDERSGQYYLHHFHSFQPDLNINHPPVRDEIKRIMGFWIELGVSGFRVDAAPYLIEDVKERARQGVQPQYEFLRDLREFLDRRRGDALLLAEANVPYDSVHEYFGDGEHFQMLFNFTLNQYVFLALAQGKAEPITRTLGAMPTLRPVCQWLNFVRNHDELTLDMLDESEREEVYRAFAPDPDARIFDRGIRRRLPPMLGGDPRRVAMVYSLTFTLPGTPMLRYGEEIGMGDDLSLEGRTAVRTPMQWDDSTAAGFSDAPEDRLVRPVVRDETFGYQSRNVDDQQRETGSLLNQVERMVRQRKHCPEFGWGKWAVLDAGDPAVLALVAWTDGEAAVSLHNLGDRAVEVRLSHPVLEGRRLVDVLGDGVYPPNGSRLALNPYGYRWLRTGLRRG